MQHPLLSSLPEYAATTLLYGTEPDMDPMLLLAARRAAWQRAFPQYDNPFNLTPPLPSYDETAFTDEVRKRADQFIVRVRNLARLSPDEQQHLSEISVRLAHRPAVKAVFIRPRLLAPAPPDPSDIAEDRAAADEFEALLEERD